MSGIFGYIKNKSKVKYKEINIRPMLLWNRIYGNSLEDCLEKDGAAMGCCVENLSDSFIPYDPVLKPVGQPAVIDAVLYNRDELAEKCGIKKDVSDPELLLQYIKDFGIEAIKDVNGDFAGAIYNDDNGTLLLFRDHMGIRPLFYYADNDFVAFSSDLRGLIALPEVDASINEDWIYQTVSGYSADTIDNTPYERIKCVTPGSYMTISFENGKLKQTGKKYWRLRQKKIKLRDEKAYQNRLKELISDSVKRRLAVVSGPVGAELSGGLDSGVIDILINRTGRKGIYYSWSLDPNELKMADKDERLVIEDICRQENIVCNYSHMVSDYSIKLGERMSKAGIDTASKESNDFRFAFPTWSNTYTLFHGAQFVAEHGAKAMFTGHGGDEGVSHRCSAFEMYHYHEYYRYLRHIWSATDGQKHRVFKTISISRKNIKEKKRLMKEPFVSWYSSPELLNPEFAGRKQIKKAYSLQFDHDPVEYINTGGVRNRLDNIALYGALSGVRYMVPYLDYRVIDFAVSIPRYLYMRGRKNRYIFREAFKDIIPESLYKLNIKEDTSYKNMDPSADWYESYAKRKAEIINKLDRDFWGKYLNFEEIDKLSKAGKPTDEEYADETRRLKPLLLCALAQNLIEKSREK